MPMSLPTRQDINVNDSLDERTAYKHFLSKSLTEADALFAENSAYYQEDHDVHRGECIPLLCSGAYQLHPE